MLAATMLFWSHAVRAQSGQEKIIQQRLERAGTLDYEPAGKAFSTGATAGSRQASVRAFAFGGRTVNAKAGDGAFHAKSFHDGRGSFRAGNFSVKPATAVDRQALSQADRTFDTRPVDVHDDRAATKSANTSRQYVNSEKPFLVPGTRQDRLDEIRDAKSLNIEQIRELLNKNR